MTRQPSGVRSFLHLLKASPSLLPEAPQGEAWRLIEHRTKDEVHSCLRCGERAAVAYIAAAEDGPRWLDLCARCDHWLRAGLAEAEREEESAGLRSWP